MDDSVKSPLRKNLNPHIYFVLFAALLSLAVMLGVSYRIGIRLDALNGSMLHTTEVLRTLGRVNDALFEAETSSRGYVLTGNANQKLQYQVCQQSVQELLAGLKALTADNKAQQQRLARLDDLITRKLDNYAASMRAMENETFQLEQQSLMTGEGALLTSQLRTNLKEIDDEEQNLLLKRRTLEQSTLSMFVYLQWGGAAVAAAMLCLMFYFARREAANRQEAAAILGANSLALEAANKVVTDLSTMTELLQSSASLAEAGEILAGYGGKLFQGDFGGIYVLNPTRDEVEPLAVWGECPNEPFAPGDCWSLRRGQPHLVRSQTDVKCRHLDDSADGYICVPMAAQHETLGVLHVGLTSPEAVAAIQEKRAMASTMAAQVALALRNLQLREQLREMSIRDALTGLLNRRYLEESLLKEISRSLRKGLPLSVVMIDIDHFKAFNDTFGHEAGDTVLRELAHLFQKHVREGDFACRLGGEEFVLILPEATREAAFHRAEKMREEIKKLQLVSGAHALGVVTISAGVAALPEDGDSCELLLAAADSALYLAKERGRDRVEMHSRAEIRRNGEEPLPAAPN